MIIKIYIHIYDVHKKKFLDIFSFLLEKKFHKKENTKGMPNYKYPVETKNLLQNKKETIKNISSVHMYITK